MPLGFSERKAVAACEDKCVLAQAPEWVTPQMAGSLQALQSACPAAAGLLDSMCSDPQQWTAVMSDTATSLPSAWQAKLSSFQRLLVHKVPTSHALACLNVRQHNGASAMLAQTSQQPGWPADMQT